MPVKHTYRTKDGEITEVLGPAKAIRRFCAECYGWCECWQQEVKDCPSPLCPLFPFRLGKDPGKQQVARERGIFPLKRRQNPI